jgi:RecB family exonuclease
MQTPDERATVYAYNFFRLLSRAGHPTLLFASADAGSNSKGMSRFVMQMLVSPQFFTVTKGQLQEPNALSAEDTEHLATAGMAYKDLGRLSLSPSAINTYIECPRLFYYQYILGKRTEDEEEAIFKSSTMGTFVHEAIEYIYTDLLHAQRENNPPKVISPDEIDAILADNNKLEDVLTHAYERINADWAEKHNGETDHYKPEEHKIEKPILLTYIRRILERDRKDAQVGLKIAILEANRFFEVDVPEVGKVRVGGRIDRLDIYGPEGNERLRVVDYKSGSYKSDTTTVKMDNIMVSPDKKYVRQTFIYSQAVMPSEMPVEPNLFFCCRDLKEADTTVSVDKSHVTDYRTLSTEFMKQLEPKVAEIMSTTDFPLCEENKCKSYCPFLASCGRKPQNQEK